MPKWMVGASPWLAHVAQENPRYLRRSAATSSAEHINAPVSVYLAAPAEYIPRDFIAELLQRLCEAYLVHENCRMPEPIYKERKHNIKRALGRMPGIVRLVLETTVVLGIITWLAWPVIGHLIRAHYHYHYYYISSTNSVRHWFDRTYTHIYNSLHSTFKTDLDVSCNRFTNYRNNLRFGALALSVHLAKTYWATKGTTTS